MSFPNMKALIFIIIVVLLTIQVDALCLDHIPTGAEIKGHSQLNGNSVTFWWKDAVLSTTFYVVFPLNSTYQYPFLDSKCKNRINGYGHIVKMYDTVIYKYYGKGGYVSCCLYFPMSAILDDGMGEPLSKST
ncbi:5268_t:CDS:2 [Scutellospora calospora]|uniref:5268_t:CDS:1 n=1 Tax=Scutellospora calospora TaxID=85575 RepID=A0ACA9KMF4_9GLOM|nr:5268_t:CDS:2 [Scutellospora calospora]